MKALLISMLLAIPASADVLVNSDGSVTISKAQADAMELALRLKRADEMALRRQNEFLRGQVAALMNKECI